MDGVRSFLVHIITFSMYLIVVSAPMEVECVYIKLYTSPDSSIRRRVYDPRTDGQHRRDVQHLHRHEDGRDFPNVICHADSYTRGQSREW